MESHIVMGLGYGDEGKGLTTDYLASTLKNPIVVRYSGGQQAGHTVMVDGIKHIHSNFCSGSLRGVPSYFSEHTTFYPVTIARELAVLKAKGINPKLILHPLAKLTTPFDVFCNRLDNKNLKDGSCGLGVGKTMKRNESPFKLHAIDLISPTLLASKLESIQLNYYSYVTDYEFTLDDVKFLEKENELFLKAILEIPWIFEDYDILHNYDNIIFEGSQGILLDMDHGVFPHVTFANTTSKNAHEILNKIRVDSELDIRTAYYVTRCYSTRHGSGPFVEEDLKLINNQEEINVFNEYQKEFKVASLNYGLLNFAINADMAYACGINSYDNQNLVITCLDQLPDFEFDFDKLTFKFDTIYESFSPYSEDIIIKEDYLI